MGVFAPRKVLSVLMTVVLSLGLLAVMSSPVKASHGNYNVVEIGYGFEDISGTGTLISGGGCDDCFYTVPLPFAFNFYGTEHSTVFPSSNGYLTFGSGSSDFSPDPIPNTQAPNDLVAALWTDLRTDNGGAIYTETRGVAPNRYQIVQWENVPKFSNTGLRDTFQIKLNEGANIIQVHYEVVTAHSDDVSAGIENAAGTLGVQLFNTPTTPSLAQYAVCYDPEHGGACGGSAEVDQGNARTIACSPDEATNEVGTTHIVKCSLVDRFGQPAANREVTFTSSGPGSFTTTTSTTSDSAGQVEATVTSEEAGTQTITATLTDQSECSRAAGDPENAPQGVCSDSVTKTWTGGTPPPPPPPDDETATSDVSIRYRQRAGAFTGRVVSSRPECQGSRRIVLKKELRGRDRVAGRTTSAADGSWRIAKSSPRGRYYAVARVSTHALEGGATLTCTRARSASIRV